MHSSRMPTIHCSDHLGVGVVSAQGVSAKGSVCQGVYASPAVKRMTDRFKNITVSGLLGGLEIDIGPGDCHYNCHLFIAAFLYFLSFKCHNNSYNQ